MGVAADKIWTAKDRLHALAAGKVDRLHSDRELCHPDTQLQSPFQLFHTVIIVGNYIKAVLAAKLYQVLQRLGIYQVTALGQFVQHGIGCGKGLARTCRILAEGGNVLKDTMSRGVIHQGEHVCPVFAYAVDQERKGIDIGYFIA